uniref:AsmA protein n=1 Tax=Candidatus Kentrum sp. MB TaxID=2138164 RepID=A0A450X798_9GAMM|nr:MAG: AsmA protein [Candidatus Kentron sp. MB]VFK29933.1 MAG: AsmA protein [Candidatus Kentron sp. MB]VFK75003.1 MAG: AsmA protein [Candidatus Kentron sp. MB]
MRALLKAIGIIIGIVVILFVAIAVIVPVYFHPNDYKEEIAEAVQEKTGRKLDIGGDIVLSVFPWIAIELSDLELGNAPGFPDGKFARLDQMEVGVKLLPLLQKRLEIRTVKVHGLELNLAKDKNGRANWSDLIAQESKKEAPEKDEKQTQDTQKPEISLAILGIGGLDIQNAALRWNDAQNNQHYQLEKLTIETGAIAPESLTPEAPLAINEPIDFKASFDLKGNQPEITGHVDTSAKFTADFAAGAYRLSQLQIATRLAGKAVPGGKITLDLGADIDADLVQQLLRIQNLRLAAGQIDANGAIKVTRFLDNPAFDGTLQLASFNPRTLLNQFGGQAPETADPKALTSASLSTSLTGTTQKIRLQSLTVRLDQTTLRGMLAINDFSSPAIRFDLKADAIDLDRYLPPKSEQATTTPAATPGAAASGAAQLPLDTLRSLNANGKARIGKITIANLKISNIALDLKAKGGVIRAHPVKMNLYQGSYSGNIGLDARQDKLHVSLSEKLTGVQIGPLLRDLQGDDLLSGKFRFALTAKLAGATPEDFKKTVSGKADFNLENGMIKGIDIAHMVCSAAESMLNSGVTIKGGASEGTKFREFTGQLPITKGRVGVNHTVALKTPLLGLTGKSGAINLGKNHLDNVTFIVTPKLTCKGQTGKALKELSGLDIPITCNGPMEISSCLNTQTLTTAVIKAVGKRLEKEAIEKVKEKAREEIGKAVSKGLENKIENELGKQLGNQLGDELGKGLGEALGGQLKGIFGQ